MILRRALATAFLTTVVSTAANAATFTWDGGGANPGWSTVANWAGNVAPSAITDDVVIPFFAIDDSIINGAAFSVNSVKSEMGLRIWADSSLDVSSSSSTKDFGQYYNGILSGSGDFTLSGVSTIAANDLSMKKVPLQTGIGSTINNGTLTVPYGLYLDGGRSLVNNGSLTLGGSGGARLDLNGGGVSDVPGGGQIDNFGTLVFNTSSIAPVTINVSNPTESGLATVVHNESSGIMEHTWTGLVTIDAPFVNDGTLHIGAPSKFALTGSFVQSAGGLLAIDIDSANTSWTNGARTFADIALGGTLELDATKLYAPKVGDTYTLFKATTHQGAFKTLAGGTGFDGLSLTSSWSGTSFVVTVVPEPEQWAMLLAGAGLMGAIARRRKQQQS